MSITSKLSTLVSYYNDIKSTLSFIANFQEKCDNKIDNISISIFNGYKKTKHYANPCNLFGKNQVKLYDATNDAKYKNNIKKIIKLALFALAIFVAYQVLPSIGVIGLLAYKFFKIFKGSTSPKQIIIMQPGQTQQNNCQDQRKNETVIPEVTSSVAFDSEQVNNMVKEYTADSEEPNDLVSQYSKETDDATQEKPSDPTQASAETGQDWEKAFTEKNQPSNASGSSTTNQMTTDNKSKIGQSDTTTANQWIEEYSCLNSQSKLPGVNDKNFQNVWDNTQKQETSQQQKPKFVLDPKKLSILKQLTAAQQAREGIRNPMQKPMARL